MKKKGFTLIELMVLIAIVAMLAAILAPACNKIRQAVEEAEIQDNAQVAQIENGNLNLKVGITYKILLSPSFVSDGSAPTMSIKDPPAGISIGVEEGDGGSVFSYLYWTPQETGLSKMIVVTQSTKRDGSEMKEERIVEVFVH